MGVDRSGSYLRGLLVPDPRLSLWQDESGEYDAAGARLAALVGASPVADVPEPQRATDMALRATGAATAAVHVRATRAGLPVVDEAGLLWRPTADPDSLLRGDDAPSVAHRWEPWQLGGGTRRHPHAVRLDDDSVLACWWLDGTGIRVQRREASGTLAAEVAVASVPGYDPHPCLLHDPETGRTRLYAWRQAGADWQVQAWYSDDDGDTWTEIGDVLEAEIDGADVTDVARLRAAAWNGQILLVGAYRDVDLIQDYRDRLIQWAASDGGHLFSLIARQTGSATSHGTRPDIVVPPGGGFIVGAIVADAVPDTYTRLWRLGSAWEALDVVGEWGSTDAVPGGDGLADVTATPGATLGDADLALVLDEDGAIIHLARGHSAETWCPVVRSIDDGLTWRTCGQSTRYAGGPGQSWSDLHSDEHTPEEWAAVSHRGRIVVVSGWRHAGALTGSIAAWYLGGWDTHTMPHRGGGIGPTTRTAWDRPWHSICTWAEAGLTTAGAGAEVLVGGYLSVTGPYSAQEPVGAATTGLLAEASLQPMGGATGRLRLRTDSGAAGYDAILVCTDATIQIVDGTTGLPLSAAVPIPAARYRVRVDVDGSAVQAWYAVSDDTLEDRVWTSIGTGVLADHGGGGGAYVEYGVPGATVVRWFEAHNSEAQYCGDHWQTWGPRSRYARSVVPSGVYVGKGIRVSALTGPAQHGDAWNVTPTYEYPPAALDPGQYPSPRHPWRSRPISEMGATTATLRVSWQYGSAAESLPELSGAWLDRLNCGGVQVWLHYGGAWHLASTVGYDAVALDVAGQRMTPITPSPGGSATWRRDEMAGGLIESIVLPALESAWTGRIAHNSPGSTRTSTGRTLRPHIDVTTSTAGIGATIGARIHPVRALLAWLASDHAATIRGVQIRIPVDATATPWTPPGPPPEGYYEIGIAAIGSIYAWGWQYGHGRRLAHEPGTEIVTALDGSRSAIERAPVRRRVEVSWPDGVPGGDWLTGSEPDFVSAETGAGAVPVGWYRDTPVDVADQLRVLAGAASPVVYLPRIDRPETWTSAQYVDWGQGAIYGRITEAVALDSVDGDEGVSERWRLQSLVVEEEL